jgi:diguanylate cyclase (GGDEF)-like protein
MLPYPKDEEARVAALQKYRVLDTPPDEAFDRLTRVAALATGVPIALVSLVDRDRQWFKSRFGLDAEQTPRELAFCAHAICQDKPLVVSDAAEDRRFADNPLVTGDPGIRFYAGAQLRTHDNHNLGTICVIDTQPRNLIDRHEQLLEELAAMVVEQIELRHASLEALQELEAQLQLSDELRQLASRDWLTGALNRRAFTEQAEREWQRAKRYGHPLSLITVDVDRFKHLNDTFGHAAGDAALKGLSLVIQSVLRARDVFGRVGGDEFAILAPQSSAHEARALAERILHEIGALSVESHLPPGAMTASLGVTDCQPMSESIDDALRRADAALYDAKAEGRDSVAFRAVA